MDYGAGIIFHWLANDLDPPLRVAAKKHHQAAVVYAHNLSEVFSSG